MIKCEGILHDCKNIIAFSDSAGKKWFLRTYCKNRYEMCEYYRMLMQEKYADEHPGESKS